MFNVLIGNHDAHMENVSFLVGPGGITLAPFYDLVSTVIYANREHNPRPPYWPDVELAIPIGKTPFFADVARDDVIAFGIHLGLRESVTVNLLDTLVSQINHGLSAIVEGFRSFTTAGQQRVINAILRANPRDVPKTSRRIITMYRFSGR